MGRNQKESNYVPGTKTLLLRDMSERPNIHEHAAQAAAAAAIAAIGEHQQDHPETSNDLNVEEPVPTSSNNDSDDEDDEDAIYLHPVPQYVEPPPGDITPATLEHDPLHTIDNAGVRQGQNEPFFEQVGQRTWVDGRIGWMGPSGGLNDVYGFDYRQRYTAHPVHRQVNQPHPQIPGPSSRSQFRPRPEEQDQSYMALVNAAGSGSVAGPSASNRETLRSDVSSLWTSNGSNRTAALGSMPNTLIPAPATSIHRVNRPTPFQLPSYPNQARSGHPTLSRGRLGLVGTGHRATTQTTTQPDTGLLSSTGYPAARFTGENPDVYAGQYQNALISMNNSLENTNVQARHLDYYNPNLQITNNAHRSEGSNNNAAAIPNVWGHTFDVRNQFSAEVANGINAGQGIVASVEDLLRAGTISPHTNANTAGVPIPNDGDQAAAGELFAGMAESWAALNRVMNEFEVRVVLGEIDENGVERTQTNAPAE